MHCGAGSQQRLTVRVEDRNETNPFPVGKQRNSPAGLFYTGSSGIWQTVWIEPVRAAHIDKLDITPDLTGFTVTPRVSGTRNERAEVVVSTPGGAVVAHSIRQSGCSRCVSWCRTRACGLPMTRISTTSRSGW